MPRSIARSVRYAFATVAAAALLLAGVQSVASAPEKMGLSTCGWDANPCVLEELVVKAPAARPAPAVESTPAVVALPVQHARVPQPATPAAQS